MHDHVVEKRVLAVSYSQSGQSARVMDALLAPLRAQPGWKVDLLELRPDPPYPFPWPFMAFLDAFPEAAAMVPPALAPFQAPEGAYDLVVLGWTVWFLAPAPPIVAFLKDPRGQALLRDCPVVSVVSCRNMWTMALEGLKALVAQAGGRLEAHLALTDPGPALATFITTPRWLLTGRNGRFLGLPPAGLDEAAFARASGWGAAIRDRLLAGSGPYVVQADLPMEEASLVTSERAGRRMFKVWSRFVRFWGPPGSLRRWPPLLLFATYLVLAILVIVPLASLFHFLARPLKSL